MSNVQKLDVVYKEQPLKVNDLVDIQTFVQSVADKDVIAYAILTVHASGGVNAMHTLSDNQEGTIQLLAANALMQARLIDKWGI